jgi:fumarate hydratase class I
MTEFRYQEPFLLGEDKTDYQLLTSEHVSLQKLGDKEFLIVEPEALTLLARKAMKDVSFFLRPSHQEKVAAILQDPEASDNDRFVARAMLKNSVISAEGKLPFCQDTGTATVVAKKGQLVLTEGNDAESLSRGIFKTFTEESLRYSQTVPLTMYEEKNSGTNLPAQIDIYATPGDEYRFLFVAKGGGSANKTFLFQLGVSNVPGDNQLAIERESGLHGILGQFGQDSLHRLIQVDLNDLCRYFIVSFQQPACGILIQLLQPDPVPINLGLHVPIC